MSVIVYIWNNSPAVIGHISLKVGPAHISFWPRSAAKPKKDIKLSQAHEGGFSKSYKSDCRLEGKPADKQITINGLDESKMLEYWRKLEVSPERYNMRDANCSTLVAHFLELGSNIPMDGKPSLSINEYVDNYFVRWLLKVRFGGGQIKMWTPNSIENYALKIKRTLKAK